MNILQMSVAAGVLLAAVIILRAISLNRLPKIVFLAFWAVAVLRLMIPFSVPSPFSAYALLNVQTELSEQLVGTPMAMMFPASEPIDVLDVLTEKELNVNASEKSDTSAPATKSAFPVWTAAWLVGTLLCGAYFTIAYIRHYRRFRTARFVRNNFVAAWLTGNRFLRTVRVKQSGLITAPMTYGVFRPVILLPESLNWTREREIGYILAHEGQHIRRFDALWKLVLTAALCVHWFNPLVWVMYVVANRDLELTCDETVVRRFGAASKKTYAYALVRFEESKSAFAAAYSGFGRPATEQRVRSIMKYRKSSALSTTLAIVLFVTMTATLLTACNEREYEPTIEPPPSGLINPTEKPPSTPIPILPDEDLPDEWPAAYLPEGFPRPTLQTISNVRCESNEIVMDTVMYPIDRAAFMDNLGSSGHRKFESEASDSEYGFCYISADGWQVMYTNAVYDADNDIYTAEIRIKQIEGVNPMIFIEWPTLDMPLGLEELTFSEWPAEYLPDDLPEPIGYDIVSMFQKDNGVFIVIHTNDMASYARQLQDAGYIQTSGEGFLNPERYKNPFYNNHGDRVYWAFDEALLEAFQNGKKVDVVLQVIKAEDTAKIIG